MMRDAAPQGTYKVQALDRAFAVLDLLGESDIPLGLAQVASSLQLHKSTAHRFLMVLERHRMVERTASGKFRLGLRLFDLGNRAIGQYDLGDVAQLVRALPCHGRGRGFEPRRPRHSFQST
jgi:DNA-binding IclR family transcriptional regulator